MVEFANSGIILEMDTTGRFGLRPPQGPSPVAEAWPLVETPSGGLEFVPEEESVRHEEVTTALGPARRLSVSSVAGLPGGQLRRTVQVEAYPRWPTAFILQAEYENLSPAPLTLSRVADPVLLLDASRTDPTLLPYQFWSFQGAAVEWGQDFAFPLPSVFSRDNYLGHRDGGEGGGIPLVYLWKRDLGVALAHIEPVPQEWAMPVQVQARRGALVSLEQKRQLVIAAGASWRGPRTLLSLHQGDFFAPLSLYAEVMAAQGLRPASPSPEAYAPAWCSWGYEFDVRPEEILGILPKLQEMGIRWVTVDDRWFDTYGDWNVRPDTFPGGESQMREMVAAIHRAGLLAQIWWYPLAVEDGVGGYESHRYRVARIVQEHPDWLCRHPDGRVARNNRGLAILDPAVPGVQEYIVRLTRRFIEEWGFDGHKLDNIYTVPACYHSAYHENPEDSLAALVQVYRLIHETTRKAKPDSVTQVCPCGTPPNYSLLPYFDQAVTADPTSSAQVRQRIKFYKALLGPRAAAFADHVELSDGGSDFASAIGSGGIPGTKFVWPEDIAVRARVREWHGLDPVREALWKRWFALYNRYRLAEGEYLNLYDLGYDRPEAHVIRRGERLYYGFYTASTGDSYRGPVELRGLEDRVYRLIDYVEDRDLGTVRGPLARIEVAFQGALLIEAVPSP